MKHSETRTDLLFRAVYPHIKPCTPIEGEHGLTCVCEIGGESFAVTLNDRSVWFDNENNTFSHGIDFEPYMADWHCTEEAVRLVTKVRSFFEAKADNESN